VRLPVSDFAFGFEPVILVAAVRAAALLESPVGAARYLVVAFVLIRHQRTSPKGHFAARVVPLCK